MCGSRTVVKARMNGANNVQTRKKIKECDLVYHEHIGRGASGDVFRVILKSNKGDREAAAKRVPRIWGKSVEDQLGKEIQYLEKLEHPNIIRFYGLVTTETCIIILTEYASHGSLRNYLSKRQQQLPPRRIVQWAIEAAEAIAYLQRKGVTHRDIKSPNFLITGSKTLKLCDFGLARDLSSTQDTESTSGTIRWLAPEVYNEGKLSPKADIYSFGMVLLELVTCREPFEGVRSERVMWYVGIQDLRPEIPDDCLPEIRELIARCWDNDRRERPDIDEILEKLRKIETSMM